MDRTPRAGESFYFLRSKTALVSWFDFQLYICARESSSVCMRSDLYVRIRKFRALSEHKLVVPQLNQVDFGTTAETPIDSPSFGPCLWGTEQSAD